MKSLKKTGNIQTMTSKIIEPKVINNHKVKITIIIEAEIDNCTFILKNM